MKNSRPPQQFQERRLLALQRLDAGQSQADVARQLGVSKAAVSQWKKLAQAGREALLAQPHTGRPSKLTSAQLKRLSKLLVKGARHHGWSNDLWTLDRVASLIERTFDISYDTSSVWHLLSRLGWSCQKPQPRAKERDEEAVEEWRTHEWPRLKKRAS